MFNCCVSGTLDLVLVCYLYGCFPVWVSLVQVLRLYFGLLACGRFWFDIWNVICGSCIWCLLYLLGVGGWWFVWLVGLDAVAVWGVCRLRVDCVGLVGLITWVVCEWFWICLDVRLVC